MTLFDNNFHQSMRNVGGVKTKHVEDSYTMRVDLLPATSYSRLISVINKADRKSVFDLWRLKVVALDLLQRGLTDVRPVAGY